MTTPKFTPRRLIGITGYAGTGKDTVRAILEEHGYHGLAFADPMRMMIRKLLTGSGISDDWMTRRDLKEATIPELGVSYRHIAQTLGTEWGRNTVGQQLWVLLAKAYMRDCMSGPNHFDSFAISDVRFINEADFVHDYGGQVWRIDRPGVAPVRSHVSEQELYHFHSDVTIVNDGSIADLRHKVEQALEMVL